MKTIPSPNPHDIRIYDICSIELIEDVDGTWWLEAATICGHIIAVIMFAKPNGSDSFGVNVSKDGLTVREYSGGYGSDAERVYRGFHDDYFCFRGVDSTGSSAGHSPLQDE